MSQRSALLPACSLFALISLATGCGRPPAPPAEQAAAPTQQTQQPSGTINKSDDGVMQAEFQRLMTAGAAALADRSYDKAITAYTDALALYPTNIDAAKGLAEARKGREASAAEQQDTQKKRAEVARLMKQAKEAQAAKMYAEAVRALDRAVLLAPGDEAVIKALADARELLATNQGEKKKLADYDAYIAAGQAALKAERGADALREFNAALRLLPGDSVALTGIREAEKLLDSLKDTDKRRAEYTALMAQGGDALKNKRYNDAIAAFTQAEKLYPKDADALQGLSDAQKAATADAQSQYAQLMLQGAAAMRAQRYQDAVQVYTNALTLVPNDQTAIQQLALAQKALAAAAVAQTAYAQYIQTGQAALQLKGYADARVAFANALTVVPNDPAALAGLAAANYGLHMLEGNAALEAKKYGDAMAAFQAALIDAPGDPTATATLKQAKALAGAAAVEADYNLQMQNGQALMQKKKYGEAVKAFETALQDKPGDTAATAALKQAQAMVDQAAKDGDFNKHMKAAAAAMQQKKYAEAIKQYEAALDDKPDNKDATAGLKQAKAAADQAAKDAEYNKHMKNGQNLMAQKKYADAIQEFQAALQEKPGDQNATAALQLAKTLAKKK
jgi:epidermal growth factor receptor substrate 15